MILMIYDENQKPDTFTYSDSVDDASCLQPSTYVGFVIFHMIIVEKGDYGTCYDCCGD